MKKKKIKSQRSKKNINIRKEKWKARHYTDTDNKIKVLQFTKLKLYWQMKRAGAVVFVLCRKRKKQKIKKMQKWKENKIE